MQRQLEGSHDNVVGYSLAGDVTADEYRQVPSEVRDIIARYGTARVLLRLSDLSFRSIFPALDDRFRFVQEHQEDIDRLAIVSDSPATEWLSRLSEAVSRVEIRHLSRDQEQIAWAWLE